MGDQIKRFEVYTSKSDDPEIVFAGNVSFTVSGDAIFETPQRTLQIVYGRGHWLRIEEVREAN